MRIIIVGAGIVGLSTAYWLARDGHAITVIDRVDGVGQGASFANGGQLSYSYVAPLAGPSVLHDLPRWLIAPSSPIKFRPAAELHQLRWLLSFLMACTGRRSQSTTEVLLSLARRSQQALKELNEHESIAFFHRCNGKIVFYSTRSSFEGGVRQRDLQSRLGSVQDVLTRDECLDVEPSLASAADRLVGGIYTRSEEVGDCQVFCSELKRVLEAPPYRVQFWLGAEAYPLKASNGRVLGVQLANEMFKADLYVVCAGTESRRLVLGLGISLPIYPVRGYSISTQIRNQSVAPEKSVTDYANRIVYARIGGVLRAAGFADIVPTGAPVDRGRIAALSRAMGALFPGACAMDELHPWAGARPTTPTGVPLIGPTRIDNLLLNVGQGSLGFTLGPGSGQMIADIIAGRGVSTEGAFSELAPSRICEA